MWISRSRYEAMLVGLAREEERSGAFRDKLQFLVDEHEKLAKEKEEIQDDLRRLLGLKPKVVVAPPPDQEAPPRNPYAQQQFQVRETPRAAIDRLQRQHNTLLVQEENQRIQQAIREMEEEMKNA